VDGLFVRYGMKTTNYMLRAVIGSLCLATTALGDAFADFRAVVQGKIPAGWVCSEIRTIEGNTLFDVRSPENRFSVVITRRELISQQEWTSRSERLEKAVAAIIAGEAPEKVDGVALADGMGLPDGRYSGGAVSVALSDPEIWYPEIESDNRKSKAVLKAIFGTIDLYNKSEQGGTGQPATRSQSKSEGSDKPQPEAEGRSR
jgi:hypothetical protein